MNNRLDVHLALTAGQRLARRLVRYSIVVVTLCIHISDVIEIAKEYMKGLVSSLRCNLFDFWHRVQDMVIKNTAFTNQPKQLALLTIWL